MKMNGSEIIIRLLERQKVEVIAGIPGGANLPLYHALGKSKIKHILARHEQGAGFIAQGIARTTGKAGVCFATSGPGATNLITAIADAKADSIPMIAITGQVATGLIGSDAFQEVDTYGISIPVTKHNFFVRDASELLSIIPQAFKIAESGRPGPVLIDVPKDVQKQEIEVSVWPEIEETAIPDFSHTDLLHIMEKIREAERPLFFIGGGVIHAEASFYLQEIARKNSIPVVSTLMGLGAFPADDPLFMGMVGMHAAPYTNHIIEEADVIIAAGARFDDRATGKVSDFCSRAQIIHLDIDPSEINKIKESAYSLMGDLGPVLKEMSALIGEQKREAWRIRTRKIREQYPFPELGPENPYYLIRNIGKMAEPGAIVATDVGQHQMWTAQAYPFRFPRTFLTSGGLGTMGFGLPAAIGAAVANPHKQTICISGDGSFLMNIQELATLADLNLNLKILLLNNNALGLVRQQQELFFEKEYVASVFDSAPDFAGIAENFGIRGIDLAKESAPMVVLEKALKEKGPALINIPVSPEEKVYPMVPPGAANREMILGGVK
jgi:acetolactate synthase-1/2/3 large subunit